MADIAAQREARRQRILQGSQNRINRVLGQQESDKIDVKPNIEQTYKPQHSRGSSEDSVATLRQRSALPLRSQERNISENAGNHNRNTVKISPIKKLQSTHSVHNDTSQEESLNSSRSSSDAKMMLKHFEFLRIVLCMMTAYLCRRVLATGYGIFYIQSAILPFACLEGLFFVFKHKMLHNIVLPHKSSMLIGLLMLCGIKPALVQTYNKVMGYVSAATQDFALFFFAFMMANTFIS